MISKNVPDVLKFMTWNAGDALTKIHVTLGNNKCRGHVEAYEKRRVLSSELKHYEVACVFAC